MCQEIIGWCGKLGGLTAAHSSAEGGEADCMSNSSQRSVAYYPTPTTGAENEHK